MRCSGRLCAASAAGGSFRVVPSLTAQMCSTAAQHLPCHAARDRRAAKKPGEKNYKVGGGIRYTMMPRQ